MYRRRCIAQVYCSAELESHLENEDEFKDAVESFEDNIGLDIDLSVNESMLEFISNEANYRYDFGSVTLHSDFAKTLELEENNRTNKTVDKKCNRCDQTNIKFEKQQTRMIEQDKSVRAADIALKSAEKSKKYLRKQLTDKEKDIADVTDKWQADAEKYAAEVTRLSVELNLQKDLVKVLKAERENQSTGTKKAIPEKDTDKDTVTKSNGEIMVIGENCERCDFLTNDKRNMKRHTQKEHRILDCLLCPVKCNSKKD